MHFYLSLQNNSVVIGFNMSYKRTYVRLTVEPMDCQIEEGFLAASVVNKSKVRSVGQEVEQFNNSEIDPTAGGTLFKTEWTTNFE